MKGAVNRVLLATDGDFNVGITDPKALRISSPVSVVPASI